MGMYAHICCSDGSSVDDVVYHIFHPSYRYRIVAKRKTGNIIAVDLFDQIVIDQPG